MCPVQQVVNLVHSEPEVKQKFASEQHLSKTITYDCPDDNKTVHLQCVHSTLTHTPFAFS
jgi:hypothetical protein